ncbi:hypothetical protein [Niallia oryzisoli]
MPKAKVPLEDMYEVIACHIRRNDEMYRCHALSSTQLFDSMGKEETKG